MARSHHLKDLIAVEGPPYHDDTFPNLSHLISTRPDVIADGNLNNRLLKGKEPGSNLAPSDDWASALGSYTN